MRSFLDPSIQKFFASSHSFDMTEFYHSRFIGGYGFVERDPSTIEFFFEGFESTGLDESGGDDLVGLILKLATENRDGVIAQELHRSDVRSTSEFVPLRVRVPHLENGRHLPEGDQFLFRRTRIVLPLAGGEVWGESELDVLDDDGGGEEGGVLEELEGFGGGRRGGRGTDTGTKDATRPTFDDGRFRIVVGRRVRCGLIVFSHSYPCQRSTSSRTGDPVIVGVCH